MKSLFGQKVGLIACSNGRSINQRSEIEAMKKVLYDAYHIQAVEAATLYQTKHQIESGSPEKRAMELHRLYKDPEIKAIFDISGGDLANQLLPYLDFELIRAHPKPFIGYSDLTSLLNPICATTGQSGYYYLLTNIVRSAKSRAAFEKAFIECQEAELEGSWLGKHDHMEGMVIGGNIRCLLKLAGTPYFPDTQNKIILLEALSGLEARLAAYMAQCEQLGIFDNCAGVIAGQFTEATEKELDGFVNELFLDLSFRYDLPVFRTGQIGHAKASIPFLIGEKISI
ncbi:LD-carboxypeptidase [Listeria costaricensis]|uniref:LD-carboxypeptidase n=1 Tax=Listeria costaricensis TaxID=2026604 RepID=UPI000C070FAB|nr:LD-carboxypeptidase [Listeria costaricensis]